MKCVIHRRNSSLDNARHWQSSFALGVLLGRVSPRLREKSTNTFSENHTTSPLTQEPPGMVSGIGEVLNDRKKWTPSSGPVPKGQILGAANYSGCLGGQQPAVGYFRVEVYREMFECQQGNQGNSAEYGSHKTPTDEAAEWRSTRSSRRR